MSDNAQPDRKVKRYADWLYGKGIVGGGRQLTRASPEARTHAVWKVLRGPFLLPESVCTHQDWLDSKGWEVYDINAAGIP